MKISDSFIRRVLETTQFWLCSSLFWRYDKDDELAFFITCNDVFYWGTADVEELTPDNIAVLEQAISDVKDTNENAEEWATDLFCARIRGMRPQRPYFKYLDDKPKLQALFLAAGPERDPASEG